MSYDLYIWSVSSVSLAEVLPSSARWHENEGGWVYESRRWQIVVGASDPVQPEDIPEEVVSMLPGIAYRTELNLSPHDATAESRRFLARTAKSLAKAAYGVIEDPQDDSVSTPAGVKRSVSLPAQENASLLSMSWWTIQGAFALRADVSELLDTLQIVLPEALPRRYGDCEPPRHVYAETGRPHFQEFLRKHLELGLVCYPHLPVAHVNYNIPSEIGWNEYGFRCASFAIDIDFEVLKQPGWNTAIHLAWERISEVLQPFYGDVRVFEGYVRRRGRYWIGSKTVEGHPVWSWWWKGIPTGSAKAIVLGEPYRSLWPSFASKSRIAGELAFASTTNWCSDEDISSMIDSPPDGLVQPPRREYPHVQPPRREYPLVWPFSAPPSNTLNPAMQIKWGER